jgi:signal peptidase
MTSWCLERQPAEKPARGALVLAGLVGAFHVALLAIAGLLLGFGRSPYAHSALALGGNLAYLASLLLAMETVRSQLLRGRLGAMPLGPALVAALFAVASVPLVQWQLLAGGEANPMTFSGQRLLPAAAESWLATLLAGMGGPYAALAYRLAVNGTEWLSPLLPSLSWTQAAIVAAIAPAAGAWALRQATRRETASGGPIDALQKSRGVPLWLSASMVVVVALIWLNAGLLGVRPAIVTGISMQPNLRQGDIVVTRGVPPGGLAPGDVIRFQEAGVPVIHRIKEVSRTRDGLVFITQGDNNLFPDAPVPAAAVEGEVMLTVPRLGLLPITVRRWLGR